MNVPSLPVCASSTSNPIPPTPRRSVSAPWRVSACTASGGSAAATPTPPPIWTATPTTSSAFTTSPISPTRNWSAPGHFPACTAPPAKSPAWPQGKRWALHHAILAGNLAYGAWRDGGFTIHDLTDPVAPKLLNHRLLSPPFAGGSHTPLPLPGRNLCVLADEATSANCAAGYAHTWLFDVRDPANPVSFATLPQPSEADYCARGGKFGPHNLHENRPGLFQSETTIFATWHNAGVRVFDIANPFQPKEIGYCVPKAPTQLIDTRPGAVLVTQSCDVCVDRNGVMYVTDTNAGLSVLQFNPP